MTNNTNSSATTPTTSNPSSSIPHHPGFTWNPYSAGSSPATTTAAVTTTPAFVAPVPVPVATTVPPTTAFLQHPALLLQQQGQQQQQPVATATTNTPSITTANDICPNVVVTTRAQKRASKTSSSTRGRGSSHPTTTHSLYHYNSSNQATPSNGSHRSHSFDGSSDGEERTSSSRFSNHHQDHSQLAPYTASPTTNTDAMIVMQQQQQQQQQLLNPVVSVSPAVRQHAAGPSYESSSSSYHHHHNDAASDCSSSHHSYHSSVASASGRQLEESASSSSACGDVSNNLPLVLRWINYARSMNSDEKVESCISGLGAQVRHRMLEVILLSHESPSLFADLCKNERGNVTVQLLQQLAVEQQNNSLELQQRLFHAVVCKVHTHWDELSQSQLGAIGLSRIFRTFPASAILLQQEFARKILTSSTSLATHRFGNFVVSEVIKTGSQSSSSFDFVFEHLCQEWSDPQLFTYLAESKFGSHVLEALLQSCSGPAARPHHLFRLAQPLLGTPAGIEACVYLGTHKQGNYPLQALFKALVLGSGVSSSAQPVEQDFSSLFGGLVENARSQILPRIPPSTIHCKNLAKALKKNTTTTKK